jgi:hypothetical protein
MKNFPDTKRTLLVSGREIAKDIGEDWVNDKNYPLTTFQALKELKKDKRFKGYAESTLKTYARIASKASRDPLARQRSFCRRDLGWR